MLCKGLRSAKIHLTVKIRQIYPHSIPHQQEHGFKEYNRLITVTFSFRHTFPLMASVDFFAHNSPQKPTQRSFTKEALLFLTYISFQMTEASD